ncbi:Ras guanine nucleotide exchange factor E [Ooceraea biroi]|uniref:Ras guanine nucleotide exchange factor E n=1 Tax=Ooceraea biroi TaxID=2015173 RepID=A0A026W7V8_OOCBI|nr:Ras guanine nucleotide exchange factor E [Ooceraea biroi]
MNGHYTPVPVRFAGASLEDLKYELEDRTSRYVACEKSCHSWPCQAKSGQGKSQRTGGLCNVLYARNRNRHRYDYTTSCKSSPCNICQLDESVGIDIRGQHGRCNERRDVLLSEEEFAEHVGRKSERQEQHPEAPKTKVLKSKVSRFGFGIPEKCRSELILGPYRADSSYVDVPEHADRLVESRKFIENGVKVWEDHCRTLKSQRHPRRYALASAAHFLYALGPWSVQPGERDSVQTLRSPSAVNIRKQPSDPELRLPVSRRQLTASVSCAALTSGGSSTVTRGRVILFWTPEYWYRPQAAVIAYRELRHHLESLQHFRREKEKQAKRKFFCKRWNQISVENDKSETTIMGKSSSLLERMLSINGARKKNKKVNENTDVQRGTAQLRRLLRMNFRITVWDLDSSVLATQLTMIDRDLFVRIPATEIEVLIHQRSSRNAPNLGAWIAFSHRIACLTVSEILAIKQLDMRTRIMARFINAADKCFALGNFQSCRSILTGLQAPPIYRLRKSWSYLRTHHASRYERMEKLSKIYKNLCCSRYQKVWATKERNPPSMPHVGHFLIKVLGLNNSKTIQAKCAPSFTRKQSITRIAAISESAAVHNNSNAFHSENGQKLMGPKQCLARRILTATLTRIRLTTRRNVADDTASDAWTCRQQYLARKFLHRWITIALVSKTHAEGDQASLRSADSTRKRVLHVATWLTNCQRFAQGYVFPLNSFACEFLLKARYREDRDNFFISLKLEPPRTK